MPMFQKGIEFLRDQLLTHAPTTIIITRNGETIGTFESVMARTKYYDVDATSKRIATFVIDFIIAGNLGYRPKANDRVHYNGRVFAVRPVEKELWRYDDPYETMIRLHTREELL